MAVADILNHYAGPSLPTGRRIRAAEQVAERARARGIDSLVVHATRVAKDDRILLDLQEGYRKRPSILYGREAQRLDSIVDRGLSAIDGYLGGQIELFGRNHPRGLAAAAMRTAIFPAGVVAISRQPYVEQQVAVENLLRTATSERLADVRTELPELTVMLTRLDERNREYGEALFQDMSLPSPATLRAKKRDGRRRFAGLVMAIYVYFETEARADQAGLKDLIEPIWHQEESARIARRRRRNALRDINPDTGEEAPSGAPGRDDEPANATEPSRDGRAGAADSEPTPGRATSG